MTPVSILRGGNWVWRLWGGRWDGMADGSGRASCFSGSWILTRALAFLTKHTASRVKSEQMFDIVLRCDEWVICVHLETVAAIGSRSRSVQSTKLFLGVCFILDSPHLRFNPFCYGGWWEFTLTVLGRRKLSLRKTRNFWVTQLGDVSLVTHPQAWWSPRVWMLHVRVLLQWKSFMLWKLSRESVTDVAEFQLGTYFIRRLGISLTYTLAFF